MICGVGRLDVAARPGAFHDAGIGDDKIDRRKAIEVLDPSCERRAIAHINRGNSDFGPQYAAFACRIRKSLLVAAEQCETAALAGIAAVSYTHLTLPTKRI